MAVVKLIEVSRKADVVRNSQRVGRYTLREVFINPEHVVCLREDPATLELLHEGQLPDGIDARQRFTRVQMNRGSAGLDIVVVGCPSVVEDILQTKDIRLIKG
jgi:hypothetical protein